MDRIPSPTCALCRFWWDVVEERPPGGFGDVEEFAAAPYPAVADTSSPGGGASYNVRTADSGDGDGGGEGAASSLAGAARGLGPGAHEEQGTARKFLGEGLANIKAALKEVATELLPTEPLPPPLEGTQPTISIRLSPPQPELDVPSAHRHQPQPQPHQPPHSQHQPQPASRAAPLAAAAAAAAAHPPSPAAAIQFAPDDAVHLPTSPALSADGT